MLFLAQFLGSDVVDSADNTIGTLIDIIATPNGAAPNGEKYPPITAIVVKDRETKLPRVIPFAYVTNLDKEEVTLKTLAKNIEPKPVQLTDIYLYRDVLDRQIVDLEGTRVVRVNDLQFGTVEGKTCVIGIDVSTRGILRRIGLDRYKPFSMLKPKFIDWENIQVVGASLKLSTASNELVKLHPADLANIVEELNISQSQNLMASLDADTAAKVFEELEPEFRHYILKLFDPKRAAFVLAKLATDELVDYFKLLPRKEAKKLLATLDDEKKSEVLKFIQYEDDTAGGLMTTEIVKGNPNWTVGETIDHVKKVSKHFRSINFIYIVNEREEFLGIVSLRALLTESHEEKIKKVMKRIKKSQTVGVNADVDEIAQTMMKYRLSTIAVIDETGRLQGIITADDILSEFVPEELQD